MKIVIWKNDVARDKSAIFSPLGDIRLYLVCHSKCADNQHARAARDHPQFTQEVKIMRKSALLICLLSLAALCYMQAQTQDALNVAQNNGQTVEEVYAHLSSLKLDERRKAFVAVDGKMKAKLWLLHFTLFELNRNLNEEQTAYVDSLKTLVRGKDLDTQRDEVLAHFTGQRDRIIALFGEDEARRLVAEIGSERLAAVNK